MQQKEWFTVQQTLKLLEIKSRTTLYNFLNKYNVRVTKPLGKTYINYADVMKTFNDESVTMGI